ncbi:MAG: serine/threonine-protein kinase, partial [candidate division KSB1 bacterium]
MAAVKVLDHKYEILSEIKRGGFGVIYLGRDRLFDKPVAIKAISPELLGEAKYLDLFQAESLAVARLNHHNIIRIYDIKHEEEGQFYIIMEYIDGLDLRQLINAARKDRHLLPPHLSAYIMAEACAGLDYAHTRRDPDTHQPLHLIHQDISPGNIMLNQLGEVKIIDFGLANARRRPAKAGENEILIQGKLSYLAPEQAQSNTALDHRIDIFALGTVFYEMLTGQRLFKESSPNTTVQNLRNGNWDLALLKATDTPELLVRIVERALQKDPRQRYQSANQMYVELMNFLATREPVMDYALELGNLVQRLTPARAYEPAAQPPPVIALPGLEEKSDGLATGGDFTIAEAEMVLNLDERKLNFSQAAAEEKFETTPALPFAVEVPPQIENERAPASEALPQGGAFYKVLAEEEEENEARTIIDVVRLSARTHRKAIILTFGAMLAAFALFVIGDVW